MAELTSSLRAKFISFEINFPTRFVQHEHPGKIDTDFIFNALACGKALQGVVVDDIVRKDTGSYSTELNS